MIDQTLISENGTEAKCPECKSRLWFYKESFGARALNKSGEIYCSHCSSKLGHTIVCPGCKTLYPDYFVVRSAKKVRRRSAKRQRSNVDFQFSAPVRKSRSSFVPKKETVRLQRSFKVVAGIIVFVTLVCGGAYGFHQYNKKTQYSVDYMRALYGIKTGTDTCDQVLSDLKRKLAAQSLSGISVSTKDSEKLSNLKDKVDKLMTKINSPPEKFTKADKQIKDLYRIYASLNTLTLAPVGSPENFTESTSKLQDALSQGFQKLKADMPPKLSEEFKTAQVKYKSLRDM
ncbi:MAG: hypothetical protein PHD01_18595 [Geobacteraceae bacterium]|nr:hypothetical protein [Geobacteraceae bacterium]